MKKFFCVLSVALACLLFSCCDAAFAAPEISANDFVRLCADGTLQEVKDAIKNGVDVNAKDDYGRTALMAAARFNENPEVISLLLKKGADINAQDNDGDTALIHSAISGFNPEVITILLINSADVKIINKDGKKAIDYARAPDEDEGLSGESGEYTAAYQLLKNAGE
jgi:ankyrin repeat protein